MGSKNVRPTEKFFKEFLKMSQIFESYILVHTHTRARGIPINPALRAGGKGTNCVSTNVGVAIPQPLSKSAYVPGVATGVKMSPIRRNPEQ